MTSTESAYSAALVAALLSFLIVLVGACSPSPAAPDPSPSRTDLPSSVPADERAQVPSAYERFWAVTVPLAAKPAEEWEPELRKVSVDPQRTQLLEGYRALRDRNLTLYGEVLPRVTAVEIAGDDAQVTDCQDASRSGQADATTGQRKNVGIPRNPVSARLRLADGQWKVAEIRYPGGAC